MTDVFNFLSELASSEESPLEVEGKIIGWHVILFDKEKNAIGAGFNQHKESARRVAIAEAAERKLFDQIKASSVSDSFLLSEFNTTCGFAAGFESDKARQRAIAEAIERWAWSKWIDDKNNIRQVKVMVKDLSSQAKVFYDFFDSVLFYEKTFLTKHIPNFPESIKLGIVIGLKGNGIFPGSRVATINEDLWDHSLVEAWRHLDISMKYKGSIEHAFPYGRIFYFSQNKEEGMRQINEAQKNDWPVPEILLMREYETKINNFYLWRALVKDYVSWGIGDNKRFVF